MSTPGDSPAYRALTRAVDAARANGAPAFVNVDPPAPPARDDHGRRIGAWVVGRNIAGYMPESDTMSFVEWSDAWTAMWDEARRYADEDDALWEELPCSCEAEGRTEHRDECYGTMRATVDSMSTDAAMDPTAQDTDWSMTVNDYNDRPIAFWVQWNGEEVADDAEDEYDATAITSVWSSYGHEFIGTGEYDEHDGRTLGVYESCLTCGAHYVLRATPDAFSDGAYQTSTGGEPAECKGVGASCHGECDRTGDERCTPDDDCPCLRCTG
jgi:hypothetical protein